MRVYGILAGLAMGLATMAGVQAITPESKMERPAVLLTGASVKLVTPTVTTQGWSDYSPAGAAAAVEGYFNNMRTLAANFTQTVTGETWGQNGTLYVKKPGKFVFNYDTPSKEKLISTGSVLYFIDDKGTVTQLPRDAGMAKLLGAKTVSLSAMGAKVVSARSSPSLLQVTLGLAPAKGGAGLKTLVLTFDRIPGGLVLRKMAGTDLTNVTTTVELDHVQQGLALNDQMFMYDPSLKTR